MKASGCKKNIVNHLKCLLFQSGNKNSFKYGSKYQVLFRFGVSLRLNHSYLNLLYEQLCCEGASGYLPVELGEIWGNK